MAQSERSALLDILSDVKMKVQDKLGIADFPIPQFIIIGKQSVGKSRLIESLAGEQFNFVSGTLGSRRPTILEFRNVGSLETSSWKVMDRETKKWNSYPVSTVMDMMAEAHESLGSTVSHEPVCVRVESAHCVDMQVVDLPGFREFSIDSQKEALAKEIESLNTSFMNDERNVMICVEEAGDASTMATLMRCKAIDSKFRRTILVRNKLDKYYGDLNHENIGSWLDGHGDLPKNLPKFTLTLPHWTEKDKEGNMLPPPQPFVHLRKAVSDEDQKTLESKGAEKADLEFVGFTKFAGYMEDKTEEMFIEAIGPILSKLRELKTGKEEEVEKREAEMTDTNPELMASTIRDCGKSFAHALQYVMEGAVRSRTGRQTVEEELREFSGLIPLLDVPGLEELPSEDFCDLEDYLDFLGNEARLPAYDIAVNGGAQLRRLMQEIEIYYRFAENPNCARSVDVLQARGVSLNQMTWRDVIVKLLRLQTTGPLRSRLMYIGHRLRHFFSKQKDVLLDFMLSIKGSPDERFFSALLTRHGELLRDNELIKSLVYAQYDAVIERQMNQFFELYRSTMDATLSDPWVFLKKSSNSLLFEAQSEEGIDTTLPTFDDTRARIPRELEMRASVEMTLNNWMTDIPEEPSQIDVAVERVQALVNKTFACIRSSFADSLELFVETFFKVPLMRTMDQDMAQIKLSEVDRETYKVRRQFLAGELKESKKALEGIKECLEKLESLQKTHRARGR